MAEPRAGDGDLVRVVLRDQRLVSVTWSGGAAERSLAELSALVTAAVNGELARVRLDSPQQGDPAPDLGGLETALAQVARQSSEALQNIQAALEETMAKVAAKTGMHGDASPQHVGFVFQDAVELLHTARSTVAAPREYVVTGVGEDENAEVTATVEDGNLARLDFTTGAAHLAPNELAFAVVQAVNMALDDWEERREDAPQPPAPDPESLRQLASRASALQESGMEHLRTYSGHLNALMRSADREGPA